MTSACAIAGSAASAAAAKTGKIRLFIGNPLIGYCGVKKPERQANGGIGRSLYQEGIREIYPRKMRRPKRRRIPPSFPILSFSGPRREDRKGARQGKRGAARLVLGGR